MPRNNIKQTAINVKEDDVYDEVDHFHIHRDGLLLNRNSSKRVKLAQKEVLSVRTELEDTEEEESDDDELGKKTLPNESEVPINKWGKKRADYYGTSYIDKDFGGVNDSEEEEMLGLEEEDAISRQQKHDSANKYVDVDFGVDEEADDSEPDTSGGEDSEKTYSKALKPKVNAKELAKMSSEQQLKYFVGQDDKIDDWIQEYEERKEEIERVIAPLTKILAKIKSVDCKLKRQMAALVTTYQQYSCNILFYLFLKIDTPLEKLRFIQSHPIYDELFKFKKLMIKADSFLAENSRALAKMIAQFEESPETFADLVIQQAQKKTLLIAKAKSEAKNKVQFAADIESKIEVDGKHRNDQWADNEKRAITYEMQKNKGLTVKRKKGTEHARVKKRKQYDKALIRRRSQVPDVRREMSKYDGEKRGIRVSTIRSIKLQ